jgi:thiamine kinase-like enzyme
MLSKLFYYSVLASQTPKENVDKAPSLLQQYFEQQGVSTDIEIAGGGTLGIVFHLVVNGKRWFVKTHLPYQEERINLIKEIAIYSILYDDLHIQRIDLPDGTNVRTFLLMDELTYPEQDLDQCTVKKLIDEYSDKLKNFSDTDCVLPKYAWEHVEQQADSALEILRDKGFLSDEIYNRTAKYFLILTTGNYQNEIQLCHGDLSSKNIMMKGNHPIVIDWEDAFWSFPEYDYLYWLTFFNHRKYYSQAIFEDSHNGKEVDIAVMLLILTLKSYLSYINDTYQNNSLSFEQRLQEVLDLEN